MRRWIQSIIMAAMALMLLWLITLAASKSNESIYLKESDYLSVDDANLDCDFPPKEIDWEGSGDETVDIETLFPYEPEDIAIEISLCEICPPHKGDPNELFFCQGHDRDVVALHERISKLEKLITGPFPEPESGWHSFILTQDNGSCKHTHQVTCCVYGCDGRECWYCLDCGVSTDHSPNDEIRDAPAEGSEFLSDNIVEFYAPRDWVSIEVTFEDAPSYVITPENIKCPEPKDR